jgi:phosphoribosylamine--glycine ligase
MKVLVVGSGGREHAIAWRIAQSGRVQTVFVAPGNGGTAREHGLQNFPVTDIEVLAAFAERESIAFTVVGPETPSGRPVGTLPPPANAPAILAPPLNPALHAFN